MRGDLKALVAELERQKNSKADCVLDTRTVEVAQASPGENNLLVLKPITPQAQEWISKAGVPVKMQAFEQIAERSNPAVPIKFAKEMLDRNPLRLVALLNGLLHDHPEKRMVRMLDGQVRAFLSDKFRLLDNYDIAFTALDAVRQNGGEVIEASMSDSHMRIKFVNRNVFDAVNVMRAGGPDHAWLGNTGYTKGDDLPGGPGTVHPIVTISNSETGHGGYNVQIGLLQAICVNTAIMEKAVTQVHLGSRLEVGIYTQETIMQDNKAIFLKAKDAVAAAFKKDVFQRMVNKAKEAQSQTIANPTAAVGLVAENTGLSEDSKNSLLAHFLKDYDQTRYGLAQAIARHAQDVKDEEKSNELEEIAGKVMTKELALA